MLSMPEIVERQPQPYVAIREVVTMPFGDVVDRVFPELFRWLGAHGIALADAPFIKYNVIDMERALELEFGAPVATPVEGDTRVLSGTLAGGTFVTITWQGSFDKLYDANAALIGWARERGIKWDAMETDKGDRFACRLEIYKTDPSIEPDTSKWITDIAIKVAG